MREIRDIGNYLKKSEYAGKSVNARILAVKQHELDPKALNIEIIIDGQTDPKIMKLSPLGENDMITQFGPDELKWVGNRIKLVFSEMKKWKSGDVESSGATEKIFKLA